MEVAKRLSPDITIALRADEDDVLDLDSNINLLQEMGYNVIKSPDIDEDDDVWEEFVSKYDIVVQGNPVVIKKFQKAIDDKRIQLKFVPRVGHISATKIREAVKNGNEEFARKYVADEKVLNFLKEEIS
jgi:predicted nucleotidyltransferase